MPADPILDEQRLLRTLTDPDLALSPLNVRALCGLVVLACYDRKVTREYMIDMLHRTNDIDILMSELENAAKMRECLTVLQPKVEPKAIDEKIHVLCVEWARKRQLLAGQVAMLMQCPTTEDKVS